MLKRYKIFVFSVVALLSLTHRYPLANADTVAPTTSLNWQKLDLEQKLKFDLAKTLSGLVGADQFVVSVDVQYHNNGRTKVQPAPAQKVETPANEEDSEDVLFLSKLGLPAPAKISEAAIEQAFTGAEQPDIFSVLDKIHVNCILDESLDDSRSEVVKKVITSQLSGYGVNKIDVRLEKAALEAESEAEPQRETASKETDKADSTGAPKVIEKTIVEKFEPFKYPVTIFLSFLTVMGMMFMLFRASKPAAVSASATVQPEESKSEARAESEPTAAHEPQSVHETGIVPAQAGHSAFASSEADSPSVKLTVEKFKFMIQASQQKSRLLVIEWLNSENPAAAAAIKAFGMYLSLEEFARVTSTFSSDQRKRLRRAMSAESSNLPSVSEAMAFAGSQMMASVLNDDVQITEQNRSFLSSLKGFEVAELASQDQELAAGVLNLLPADAIADALQVMDSAAVAEIMKHSARFDMTRTMERISEVEQKVEAQRTRSKITLSPMLESAETLLQKVSPDKEVHLYTALLTSRAFDMVTDLSRRYFPSDLVLSLESSRLNAVLLKMPLVKRAELIYSLSENDRTSIYKAFGESVKMRELIDSEIEMITTDEGRKKSIEAGRMAIWKQFLALVRETIQTNPIVQENAEDVLKTWMKTKQEELGLSEAAV